MGSLGGLQTAIIQVEMENQRKISSSFVKDVCSRVVTLEDSRKRWLVAQ